MKGFSPSSHPSLTRKVHLYLQPFEFRQVTERLWLQTVQVVEVQVPATQKSPKGRLRRQLKTEDLSNQSTSTQQLITALRRADVEKPVPTLGPPLPTCKCSSQHCLSPIPSTLYSLDKLKHAEDRFALP